MESYYFCILRVVDDTWVGFQREVRIIDKLKDWYPGSIIQFSTNNDIDYCIDIEVYYDEILFDVFQVKPYSFLTGLQNNKEYCITAYQDNFKKHKEFHEQNKIIPSYIIEHEQELIIKRYDELTY